MKRVDLRHTNSHINVRVTTFQGNPTVTTSKDNPTSTAMALTVEKETEATVAQGAYRKMNWKKLLKWKKGDNNLRMARY